MSVVFAQELLPQKVGKVAGFVFGFVPGIGELGAAALGALADPIRIQQVFSCFSLLLLLGSVTALLPKYRRLTGKPDVSAGL